MTRTPHPILTLCLLLAALLPACITHPHPGVTCSLITQRSYRILRVIDGDTCVIFYDGEKTRLRLAKIDAPEPKQPGGPEATQFLRQLIENKIVTITFTDKKKRDHYGRLLCSLTLPDGRDVETILIDRNLAK